MTPHDQLQAIASFFDVGTIQDVSRAGGPSNANANFFVKTETGTYLIKIILETYGLQDKLQELAYIQHLKAAGIPVAELLSTPDGRYVYQDEHGIATLQERLPADPPQPSVSTAAQIGAVLAKQHLVPTDGLPDKRHWLRSDYLPQAIEIVKTYVSEYPRAQALLDEYGTIVKDFPGKDVIIHGDLHPENTLFADDKLVALIDWEEAGLGKAIVDFGMTVIGCCDPKDVPKDESFFALYDAYASIRPFSEQEERSLEAAVRYAAFTQAVWRFLNAHHYHPDPSRQQRYLLYWEIGLNDWKRPIR